MSCKTHDIEPRIVTEIMRCIADISYGEVVVTIHDARIVQVEKREKRRFDLTSSANSRMKFKQGQADPGSSE